MSTKLTEQQCEPCEGGVDAMSSSEALEQLDRLENWELIDVPKIEKQYTFPTFPEAIEFVDRMADLAEEEGHHPTIRVNYNVVTVTLWTHAIDGLSSNDFILAAKLDEIAADMGGPGR